MSAFKPDIELIHLLNHSNDLISISDFNGYFIQLHGKWEELTGYTDAELKSKPFLDFVHPEDVASTTQEAQELYTKKTETIKFENRYIKKNGDVIWLQWNAVIDYEAKLNYSIARDITESRLSDQFNTEAKSLMSSLIKYGNEQPEKDQYLDLAIKKLLALYEVDCVSFWDFNEEKNTLSCRQSAQREKIKTRKGLVLRKENAETYFEKILNNNLIVAEDVYNNTATKELNEYAKEYKVNSLLDGIVTEGNQKYVICIETVKERKWHDNESNTLLAITNIISNFFNKQVLIQANKELIESKERYRSVVEALNEGIVVHDLNDKILMTNDAAPRILGLTKNQLLGLDSFDPRWRAETYDGKPLDPKEHPSVVTARTGKPVHGFLMSVYKNEDKRSIISINSEPVFNANGEVYGVVVSFIDITNEKIKEQELSTALSEKNILFKELHHRIKNNLNMIVSLLSLNSRVSKNSDLKEFVNETQNRIYSIAKTHDQLLKLEELDKLNVKDYLIDLVKNIVNSYNTDRSIYELRMDIESHIIHVDKILTIGLLTNEIVSNTLKHAYDPCLGGVIEIKFQKQNSHYYFIIKDEGEGFEPKESNSIGLKLIELFVAQLSGKVTRESGAGVKYIIEIPL